VATKLAGPNPPKTRAPRAYEALKNSIQRVGLISPVIVSNAGSIIDGRDRHRATSELGVPCPQISRRGSSWLAEERIARTNNERDMDIRGEIIRLAGLRDDNQVGLFTEEAIAQACGVSLRYLLSVLEPLADSWPPLRWEDDTTVVDSLVRPPDRGPDRHEVLTYIPEVSDETYTELVADMAVHGQRVPVLLDEEGLLVDGRARWRACVELGLTPVTQVVTGNAWEASLTANRSRFPDLIVRDVVVANLPARY
jgi:ParB-like chromosome segregation protein Spo0J